MPTFLAKTLILTALLAVWAPLESPGAVVRGPYIQGLGSSGYTVRWRTLIPSGSRLRWGTDPAALDSSATLLPLRLDHSMRLSWPSPGERIYYAVGNAVGDFLLGPMPSVQLAPEASSSEALKFWVLGDVGLTGPDQIAVQQAWLDWNEGQAPDAILLLGDNAYDNGSDLEFQDALFSPFSWTLARSVLWSARGNHELDAMVWEDLFDFPTQGELGGVASGSEFWFSWDHGPVHFISLDTYAGDLQPPSPMLDWLAADLDANFAAWTIVLSHYPPWSRGSHNSDTDWHMSRVREEIIPLLEAGGVDLLLSGHSHGYERSGLLDGHHGDALSFDAGLHLVDPGNGQRPGDGAFRKPLGVTPNSGLVSVVAGSASRVGPGTFDHPAMLVGDAWLGSISIEIEGSELRLRFIDDRGAIRDHFDLVKGQPVGVDATESGGRLRLQDSRLDPGDLIVWEGNFPVTGELDLLDLRGRRVATLRSEGPGRWRFRETGLARGSYFLSLRGPRGRSAGLRIQIGL